MKLIKENLAVKKEFEKASNLVNKKTFIFYQECKRNGELYGSINQNKSQV